MSNYEIYARGESIAKHLRKQSDVSMEELATYVETVSETLSQEMGGTAFIKYWEDFVEQAPFIKGFVAAYNKSKEEREMEAAVRNLRDSTKALARTVEEVKEEVTERAIKKIVEKYNKQHAPAVSSDFQPNRKEEEPKP